MNYFDLNNRKSSFAFVQNRGIGICYNVLCSFIIVVPVSSHMIWMRRNSFPNLHMRYSSCQFHCFPMRRAFSVTTTRFNCNETEIVFDVVAKFPFFFSLKFEKSFKSSKSNMKRSVKFDWITTEIYINRLIWINNWNKRKQHRIFQSKRNVN